MGLLTGDRLSVASGWVESCRSRPAFSPSRTSTLLGRWPVNGYEHPESVKDRTHLRTVGDVFPHARTINRKTDMDHPDPYDANGPPGQTGDHNAGPLGRRHHRAKTHLTYRSKQLGLARYLWRTPRGLQRLVDATGTHELDTAQALELEHPGALDAALKQIEAGLRDRRED